MPPFFFWGRVSETSLPSQYQVKLVAFPLCKGFQLLRQNIDGKLLQNICIFCRDRIKVLNDPVFVCEGGRVRGVRRKIQLKLEGMLQIQDWSKIGDGLFIHLQGRKGLKLIQTGKVKGPFLINAALDDTQCFDSQACKLR